MTGVRAEREGSQGQESSGRDRPGPLRGGGYRGPGEMEAMSRRGQQASGSLPESKPHGSKVGGLLRQEEVQEQSAAAGRDKGGGAGTDRHQ